MIATQTTDLDRTDNFRAVVDAANGLRDQTNAGDWTEGMLVAAAKNGQEWATLELISRYEARLRRLVARANVDTAAVPDLQQAAMLGVLEALRKVDPDRPNEFFTYAHSFVLAELTEANRTADPKPAERNEVKRYWSAMRAVDGDAVRARRWAEYQRLSAVELEGIAEESGDVMAREIVDSRFDRWERKPNGRTWEEASAERGRGLDGPTFDAVHSSVTYLDADAGDDGDGESLPLHETIATTDTDQTEQINNELTALALVASLDDRDALVVNCLFGVNGETQRTAAEVGEMLGITRPRVQNVKAAALRRLAKIGADIR
ncbi:RNA polymerase sigma factor (sigma-70 family) [Actinomadura coerulea]|uniref:RNA polymerase sigma factor (Sigma-70 family) n=1 Tax=Actinomadura coerulea TaxID=46159 RepID=A0A7X0G8M5_9ACTN|nr:sigma-70 family RNA polymerase sigma factor [Actinomadura coerulea]MBB6400540.1 RNA polymerase sigma factor (sigma-70 family) [Actinomadura coerulea]GGQ07974.1 hypothetical protein GCM10010187_25090 [Actinomadura coerulea]